MTRAMVLTHESLEALATVAEELVDREHTEPAHAIVEQLVSLISEEHRADVEGLREQLYRHIDLAPSVAIRHYQRLTNAVEEWPKL